MKMYKAMVALRLLYGSKTWVPTQKSVNKIQSAKMNFLRSVKGCSVLDKIKK